MTQTTETVPFQAETRELLDLVIHSLYTHKEIFLRELVSNASDALDKLRFEALKDESLLKDPSELSVQLAVDPDTRVLCVIDNGIGMSRAEVSENLGTIARSGTKGFLKALQESGDRGTPSPELIGRFGVGFYSSFMVADEVVVETRRAGEEKGTRWASRAEGDYTIEEIDKPTRGTTVMLHLKPVGDDDPDFTQEWTLRELVRRYSDFIEYPIQMEVGEGDEKKLETLNSRKPLWTRPRSEITDEEHAEFYRHLTHDWSEPLETIHFRAEGTAEYTALLYVPRQRPMDLFDPRSQKPRIHLYVRRVFVMSDNEELVPVWLRFVRGVVDSADLPLNVSRETLQHDRHVRQIRKRVTRKVLDALAGMAEKRPEDFATFWKAFGSVLKEGLYFDDEHREEIAKVALWHTSAGDEPTTLAAYVERMPVKQREIHVLVAPDVATARRSPHLEALRAAGREVLFLTEPVDEFVLQRLTEFQGKPLKRIDQGEVDLGDEGASEERAAAEKELEPVLEAVRKELSEEVAEVRFSKRLADSPAVLVGGEHDVSPSLERFLRETGQPVPPRKRILELNASHPLVKRLAGLVDQDVARFNDSCELLLGQALIAEGSAPADPARFTKLLTDLMLASDA